MGDRTGPLQTIKRFIPSAFPTAGHIVLNMPNFDVQTFFAPLFIFSGSARMCREGKRGSERPMKRVYIQVPPKHIELDVRRFVSRTQPKAPPNMWCWCWAFFEIIQ